jgi:predicted outer membrane protein
MPSRRCEEENVTDELEEERRQLAKADLDIAEGQDRIARQANLVSRLQEDGHPDEQAEALLAVLQETLRAWQVHQSAIVDRIKYLEEAQAQPPRAGSTG